MFSFRALNEDEVPPCADVKGLLTWFRRKEFLDVKKLIINILDHSYKTRISIMEGM